MPEEGNNQTTTPPVNTPPAVPPVAPVEPPVVPPVAPTTPPVAPTEPPATTPTTPPVTPPAVPPADPIDVEKMTQEIETTVTGKVEKSVLAKIAGALGLSKKEEEEIPTDPAKLKAYIQETAKEQAQEMFKARDEKTTQSAEDKQKQLSEGAEGFKKVWEA